MTERLSGSRETQRCTAKLGKVQCGLSAGHESYHIANEGFEQEAPQSGTMPLGSDSVPAAPETPPDQPVTGPRPLSKQVPEQTISDECKYCAEGEPEWSPYAKCWIHRRPRLDKRCLRKVLGPCGEMAGTPRKEEASVSDDAELDRIVEKLARAIEDARERMTETERMVADFNASEIWLRVRAKASVKKEGSQN